jgi:hypothetical protein
MAGPEHEMAAGRGHGRLRASHADRERVIGTLKAAYVYGLVTKDEFDARVSQAFAARTYADLAVITADIPAGLAPAPAALRPRPVRDNPPARANRKPGERAVIATALLAGLLFIAAFVAGYDPVAGLLALGAAGTSFVSLFLAGAHLLGAARGQGGGGEPPPRAVSGGQGTGRRPAPDASRRQLPAAGEPRRPGNAGVAGRRFARPQLSG